MLKLVSTTNSVSLYHFDHGIKGTHPHFSMINVKDVSYGGHQHISKAIYGHFIGRSTFSIRFILLDQFNRSFYGHGFNSLVGAEKTANFLKK